MGIFAGGENDRSQTPWETEINGTKKQDEILLHIHRLKSLPSYLPYCYHYTKMVLVFTGHPVFNILLLVFCYQDPFVKLFAIMSYLKAKAVSQD